MITTRRNTKPHCYRCRQLGERKRARIPPGEPMFCSQRCAAEHAIENMMDQVWCGLHREWFENYCTDCVEGEG